MRNRRRTLTIAGAGALALAGIAWTMRPDTLDVETALVRRSPLRVTVNAEGRTQVRERFTIAAPVAGRIQRLLLEEGDDVRPGQTVAVIAPAPLDPRARREAEARLSVARALEREAAARVAQAREAAAHEARAATRGRVLHAAGALSPAERDRLALAEQQREEELRAALAHAAAAAGEVQAVRAVLRSLDSAADVMTVRSPCRGRVLRVAERSERVVAAGAPIIELGDAGALEVLVDVLSADAVRLTPGAPVEIVDWGGVRGLRGEVRAIEPSAFTHVSALGVDEQRVTVHVDLLGAPPALGDRFRVEARMVVWEADDVIVIPASAIFQRGDAWSVFVVRDGRARLQRVTIGQQGDGVTQVLEGLAPGQRVVVFPSDELESGDRVRAR